MKPQTTLIRRCAYCQKELGTVDGQGKSGVSHGICPECLKEQYRAVAEFEAENRRENLK